MFFVVCFLFYYRIAHDISVDNFQTLQDELSDSGSPTKSALTTGSDNDFINQSDSYDKHQPPLESVDSLNQKNAAHSTVSNGHCKPQEPSTVLSKSSVNGLRIEDVEKIGTDLIRLSLDKTELKKTENTCFDGANLGHKDEETRAKSPAVRQL